MSDVADRIAVQDVMLRYATGVDERDMDLYRSCFADDVEVVGFGTEVYHGVDNWASYVEKALEAYGPTQHMLSPMLRPSMVTAPAVARMCRRCTISKSRKARR